MNGGSFARRLCFLWAVAAFLHIVAAAAGDHSGLNLTTVDLPPLPGAPTRPAPDWLLQIASRAGAYQGRATNELVLDNGLIRRRFRLAPNVATVELKNLMTGSSVLRAVKPEAVV